MSWANFDDSFDTHPKTMRAGNAAVGLFARLVPYATRLTTDGMVPGEVVAAYGTKPQAAKLVKVRFLHAAGHDCPRCAQPEPGDYVIHDYLQWNKSKQQVLSARAAEAEKKRLQRAAAAAPRPGPPENAMRFDDDSSRKRNRFVDENESNRSRFSDRSPAQGHVSPGESAPRARDSQSKPVLPTEGQLASTPAATPPVPSETVAAASAACAPLVDAMTRAGMTVSWSLSAEQWIDMRAHVERCGVAALVAHASLAWPRAKTIPRSASYFLSGWAGLPAVPADAQPPPAEQSRPSATDRAFANGLDIVSRMRQLDQQDPLTSTTGDRNLTYTQGELTA